MQIKFVDNLDSALKSQAHCNLLNGVEIFTTCSFVMKAIK